MQTLDTKVTAQRLSEYAIKVDTHTCIHNVAVPGHMAVHVVQPCLWQKSPPSSLTVRSKHSSLAEASMQQVLLQQRGKGVIYRWDSTASTNVK